MDICTMTQNKRQHKFGRQIQKDLSEIFQKDPRHYFGSGLVTITSVEMSPDLGLAKTYLSVFPINESESVFKNLEEKKKEVRKLLGNKIGKQVRIVPELVFYHDDTEERASQMDKLIGGLNIPEAEENDED